MTTTIYHYVYRITNIIKNKHYYGSRTSKGLTPKEDLGFKYFSHSQDNLFMNEQRERSYNFKYKVIRQFEDRESTIEFEIYLHNKFNVGVNKSFYNKSKQTSTKFDMTGRIAVKDKDGNIFSVSLDDPRYISGDLVHHSKGIKLSSSRRNKISIATRGSSNPRSIKITDEDIIELYIKSFEEFGRIIPYNKFVEWSADNGIKVPKSLNKTNPRFNHKSLKGLYAIVEEKTGSIYSSYTKERINKMSSSLKRMYKLKKEK